MGQAIVYCGSCQTQLRGADFEKGAAVQYKGQAYCKKCAREHIPSDVLETLVKPAEKTPERPPTAPPPPTTPRPFAREERPKSSAGLLVAGLVGAAALAIVVVLASGGNPPPAKPVETAAPVRPPEPPRPAPPPVVDREALAWDALRGARAFAAAHPNDPAGQRSRFEKALRDAQGTSLEAAARGELKALEEAQREGELGSLDGQVRAASEVEDFPKALAILEELRKTRPDAVDRRIVALRELADRRYAPLREKAVDAQRRGAAADVQGLRERIAKWGLPALAADLEKALAEAIKPPSEAETYRASWAAAMEPAAGRDYAAAIRGLEKLAPRDPALKAEAAADLQDLKALQAACEETLQRLLKTPRGQKLAVGVYDEAGLPRRVEGAVTRADARGLEVDAIPVLPGELLPASLAELIAVKHPKRPAALLRALEGDPEKDAGLPERFSAPRPDPKREAEARLAFWAAERELAEYAAAAGAVAKFAALLKDFESTAFVRRNRASIQARGEGAREFFFSTDLLKAGGTFRPAKHAKAGACWTSEADGGTLKENFIELEFSMLPGVEYRGWAYVGGCCGETLAASYQVAEAEPVPIPSPLYAVNRRHANHGGPKEPSRWGWIPLPLPKAAAAGPVKVRLLTDQKGFSVACAFVSATHAKPPTEAEVREREKSKPPAAPAMSPIRDVDAAELVGHWTFEQAGTDASKNGRHGVLEGNPVPAAGRAGKALRFDGVDDCVRIPDGDGLTIKGLGITFAAWVFRPGEAAGGQPIVHRQRGGWKVDGYSLSLPGGIPAVTVQTSGGQRSAQGAVVPLQRWTHLAGTFDGTALKLYVNGAEAASEAGPAGSVVWMEHKPLTLGAGINDDTDKPNEFFQGLLDDVRLYYRALTPAEIAALAGR